MQKASKHSKIIYVNVASKPKSFEELEMDKYKNLQQLEPKNDKEWKFKQLEKKYTKLLMRHEVTQSMLKTSF